MVDYKDLYERRAKFAALTVDRLDAADVVIEALQDCFKLWNPDLDNPGRAVLREALAAYVEKMSPKWDSENG